MDRHGNVVPGLDRLLGAFQVRLGPRREMQMAAFLGELPGAGQANSLGRAGDEGESCRADADPCRPSPSDVLEPASVWARTWIVSRPPSREAAREGETLDTEVHSTWNCLKGVVAVAACASMLASCSSSNSYQTAALRASDGGDQKTAVSLAKKEVERFSGSDKCSPSNRLECGTLALAYGALASYQILDRDRAAGEGSFIQAKGALSITDPAIRASATGMVYRDVSEAFWKAGDHARAIAVFKEGRAAGGDQ